MRKAVLLIWVFLLPLAALAQFKTQAKPIDFADRLTSGVQNGVGLLGLDPTRLSMSHSYSMSYMSVGDRGFTQGLYLNTLKYQFAIPLTFTVQWGMAHQPFQGNNTSPILQNGFFLSGAQVRYKPTENTIIQLDFHQNPYNSFGGYYPGSPSGFDWVE